MKNNLIKILLPKKVSERDARNQILSKIKPRFTTHEGFRRLIILSFLTLFLLGYQPSVNFFPLSRGIVFAQSNEATVVSDQITKSEFPVMSLPVAGYLSTPFSWYHPGIDIATGLGTPIHSVADGMVLEVNYLNWGYGHHVIIQHSDSVTSLYAHMDQIYVTAGQKITTADVIGTVGLTGYTTGPHTHLEIHQDGKSLNPVPLLPPIQSFPSAEYLRPYGGNTTSSDSNMTNKTEPAQNNNQPNPVTNIIKPVYAPITYTPSATPQPTPSDLHKTLKLSF